MLSLLTFSFNIIFVSKIARALQCCALFYHDYCVFQDLMTKQILGRGHESGGLYVLDTPVPRPVPCSSALQPSVIHRRLGHPSLSSLKQLYHSFKNSVNIRM